MYRAPQIAVKLCGLSNRDSILSAVQNGADYIGCHFDPASVNCITPIAARGMFMDIPLLSVKKVAVVNKVTNLLLNNIISLFHPDYIQFNGFESPDMLKIIKSQFNCKIIKTFHVQNFYDFEKTIPYDDVVDMFLFKPSNQFEEFTDWNIFHKIETDKPWILSGDISRYNFHYIVRETSAKILDVESGIESIPGRQDPILIKSVIESIHSYF